MSGERDNNDHYNLANFQSSRLSYSSLQFVAFRSDSYEEGVDDGRTREDCAHGRIYRGDVVRVADRPRRHGDARAGRSLLLRTSPDRREGPHPDAEWPLARGHHPAS